MNCLIRVYLFAMVNACYRQSYGLVSKPKVYVLWCCKVLNHLSFVFCTFLDALKALEWLKYCKLFKLLVSRQVPPPIIRVINKFVINFNTGNVYALHGAASCMIIF